MHSNHFIIYFIKIRWLQSEAVAFIIHDSRPFHSGPVLFAQLFLAFAEHNPDLSSILMLPHSDAQRSEGRALCWSLCAPLWVIRLVWFYIEWQVSQVINQPLWCTQRWTDVLWEGLRLEEGVKKQPIILQNSLLELCLSLYHSIPTLSILLNVQDKLGVDMYISCKCSHVFSLKHKRMNCRG